MMTAQDCLHAYEEALASQQWNNIAPLLHDDISVTFSTGTYVGKGAVQGAFENNFSIIKDEQYNIHDVIWTLNNDALAVCLYHFSWQGEINGELCHGGGRGTSVFVNVQGQWLLITEHLGPAAT